MSDYNITITIKQNNNKKNNMIKIDPFVCKKNGSGPLRFKKGTTYFHGCRKEDFTTTLKCNEPLIVEYGNTRTRLPNPDKWDTHNVRSFCKNCSLDTYHSKNLRVNNIYKCKGHTIPTNTSSKKKLRSSFVVHNKSKIPPKYILTCKLGCITVPRYRLSDTKKTYCNICSKKLRLIPI